MMWCDAMRTEPGHMRRNAIARVPLPAVTGMIAGEGGHHPVPLDLGDDGGRGDRKRTSIPLHQRGGGAAQAGRRPVPVDKREARRARQRIERAAHGEIGGAEDVEPVDLLNAGDAEADLRDIPESGKKRLAPGGGEPLRIVQAGRNPLRIENHGSGDDGPGPGAAPGLVHPGDGAGGGGFLMLEIKRAHAPFIAGRGEFAMESRARIG